MASGSVCVCECERVFGGGGGGERGAEKDAHNSVLKFQDKSYLLGIFFGVHTGK